MASLPVVSKFCSRCGLKLNGLGPRFSMHPECSVRSKAERVLRHKKMVQELTAAQASRRHGKWTVEEVKTLMEMSEAGASAIEIAVALGRTASSIQSRRQYLNIKGHRGYRRPAEVLIEEPVDGPH